MRTVDRARGRWGEILPRLGIESRYLVNKHGPCPLCGGKDRFRWDDQHGSGSYYCNQCGPGPGLMLLRKLHVWDYATACGEVDKIIGNGPPAIAPVVERRPPPIEAMLSQANDPEIVERYLRSRGLSIIPEMLKGHPALFHTDTRQRYPAMLAPVVGPDGKLQAVHRTYLIGAKRHKTTLGPRKGAAIRLFAPAGVLGIAEGIETAIAAREIHGIPTWSVICADGVAAFEPPPDVKVVIFADNDANFTGQRAAYVLAQKLAQKGQAVEIRIPPYKGEDWHDVLGMA